MEKKLKKIIESMKQSRMTAIEKTRMRKEIFSAWETLEKMPHKNTPLLSPYLKHFGVPSYFRYSSNTFSRISMASAVIVLFLLIGIGYASADALPGDMLYPIKIGLIEKIQDKLTFAPNQKLALHQQRINDRFTEVEQLIKEKKITPETRSIVDSEIQVEKESMNNYIEEINKNNPEAAAQAKLSLESSINSRQQKVDNQIEGDQTAEAIKNDLSNFKSNLTDEYEADSQLINGANENPASSTSDLTNASSTADTASSTSSLETTNSSSTSSLNDKSDTNILNNLDASSTNNSAESNASSTSPTSIIPTANQ